MLDFLEISGVVTALLYVFFAAREQVICFVFGLISSLIYIYISYTAKFYFDSFINAYYVIMSVVGWYQWRGAGSSVALEIKSMKKLFFIGLVIFGVAASFLLGYLSRQYTDASLPYIDSLTTVFALIATWMVVQKHLENWLIWIVVDAIGIGMYWWKELYFTSFLFLVYTMIAMIGYYRWRKKLAIN